MTAAINITLLVLTVIVAVYLVTQIALELRDKWQARKKAGIK